MNVSFECLSDSGEFDYDILSNIDLNISNILIKPIEFEVLNAVVDTIALETPSLVIDNIPSGFQGVLFSDPSLIIEGGPNKKKDPAFGADVLRLWVSSVDYSVDVPIGSNILGQLSDVYRKVRNTAR